MDDRSRRSSDHKIDELSRKVDSLVLELVGTPTRKGALNELRDLSAENKLGIQELREDFMKHEDEQRQRDERAEKRGEEVRHALFYVVERAVVALIGAVGGAWVAINAFLTGKPHGQ